MQVVVDGILTHYEEVGNKKKDILLILHGWKRALGEWLPTAKALSDTYHVVLLDLPGFGQTARPETAFSIYDYATFVEHFLDKIEVDKITFLGHSFGGRIGIILGAKTGRLNTLILVDAAGIEKRSQIAKVKIAFFKIAKIFLPKQVLEKLRHQLGSRDYKSAGELRTIFLKIINEDLSYLLSKIKVHTLIIWGSQDKEVQQWKTVRMKNIIPYARLRVVWESGHDPHIEKPQEFMNILREELL